MPLYLTDDQVMLRDTARELMASEGSIARQLRKYRDMDCRDGFGHALWKQLAELGWVGILSSDDFTFLDAAVIFAQCHLIRVGVEVRPGDVVVRSNFSAAKAAEI